MPYIEKNELLNGIYSDNPEDVMLYIARFPTVDVVEHKKGKWTHKQITDNYTVTGQCSVCKERKRIDNFYPNCGAKMDGKETEGEHNL